MHPEDKKILNHYFPSQAVDMVAAWIEEKKIHFKISKTRQTKLGDYRPPIRHGNHRISVNHSLNKFSFLITFVHEYAHLLTWEKYERKASPHGKEWKLAYRQLMTDVIKTDAFPEDVRFELEKSIVNTKASSSSEIDLSRVLKKYDPPHDVPLLEELPEGSFFSTANGVVYQKGNKRRTRYLCLNISNKKSYLVHALTPVKQIHQS